MLYLELGIVAVLTLLNGLLAMSELAIVSSRPARLRAMVERGVVGSRRALALASDPGRFLSTVQIGITLVGVLSGAFSGATLGLRLSMVLEGLGLSVAWSHTIGVGAVVAAITFASLIIGELVPKQIALRHPERVAVRVAPAMTALARAGMPLIWLLDTSGTAILRLLGYAQAGEGKLTEEELKSVIAEAETAGVIEPGEREMIAGVMRLADRGAGALMTPRQDVDMVDLAAEPDEVRRQIAASRHTRVPVYARNPDEVFGVIEAKVLLNAYLSGREVNPSDFVQKAPVIPETADVLDALATLKQSAVHMGLVHDEYGHFMGVVTQADILEAIVGGFRSGPGAEEPHVVRRDDGSYLISGSMPIDELRDLLHVPIPAERTYHTVAGFVLEKFGYIPEAGETFDSQGWRFEVVDMDGRRVDKIITRKLPAVRRAAAG
jgi:putative hemolysin